MEKLLEQALEEGAFGYSTGLEYNCEQGCSEAEIVNLCKVAARAGGIYASHTRNRAGEAVETIAEAIRTACGWHPATDFAHRHRRPPGTAQHLGRTAGVGSG